MSVVGLASTFAVSKASGQILGANNRVRVGIAGFRGRGFEHIKAFGTTKDVAVAALVDIDKAILARWAAKTKEDFGYEPLAVQDIRQILDDKSIDALSIATCDHTHTLYTVWACQAGKDVYVEKPCSHNITEGRRCVQASEKYKRIIQHGTQERATHTSFINPAKVPHELIIAALKSGKYGKLQIAKGFCVRHRLSIGFKPPEQPPEPVNWDVWLGPAPEQPFHRNLVHYEWHWFWDFGCADIGNLGIHLLDICRWKTGHAMPKKVLSFGQRYVNEPEHGFKDQGETPNMHLSLFDYGDVKVLFEVRGLVNPRPVQGSNWNSKIDVEYHTDAGVIRGGDFYPNDEPEKKVKLDVPYEKKPGSENVFNIFHNFIDCVRSRRRENLMADIFEGHCTSTHVHSSNISYRLGEVAPLDSIRAAFGNEAPVQKSIDDIVQNTAEMLPELKNPQFVLGKQLQFDETTETFVGNAAANALLSRKYRAPYIVPENV